MEKRKLESNLTTDELKELIRMFAAENVNQDESYLIVFKDGVFTKLFGNPPKHLCLPHEEYKRKLLEKHGISNEFEIF